MSADASDPRPAGDGADVQSLLASARLGDGDAFGELCRPYETRLRRQARCLVGNEVTADELAQDTFVAAWQSLPRFDGRSRFFTWLCAILLRQHLGRLRREWSFRRWLTSDSKLHDGQSPGTVDAIGDGNPADGMIASERSDQLRRCLLKLSPKHREVVVLRFYAEESLEGIATVLGISVGTVKSRLFHALENLRKMRQDLGEGFRITRMP
ncbi:MAG: RNA polymerase sigma factor [Verrucomicrobiales bacterium]|nr:RNA polymerase sigma factor [Verrucomicrobiales bacterium]